MIYKLANEYWVIYMQTILKLIKYFLYTNSNLNFFGLWAFVNEWVIKKNCKLILNASFFKFLKNEAFNINLVEPYL